MNKQYKSFKQFYPFYLSEHMNPICRGLHFIGTFSVILNLHSEIQSKISIKVVPDDNIK